MTNGASGVTTGSSRLNASGGPDWGSTQIAGSGSVNTTRHDPSVSGGTTYESGQERHAGGRPSSVKQSSHGGAWTGISSPVGIPSSSRAYMRSAWSSTS